MRARQGSFLTHHHTTNLPTSLSCYLLPQQPQYRIFFNIFSHTCFSYSFLALRSCLVRRSLVFKPWFRSKLWFVTTVLFGRHELSNRGLKRISNYGWQSWHFHFFKFFFSRVFTFSFELFGGTNFETMVCITL